MYSSGRFDQRSLGRNEEFERCSLRQPVGQARSMIFSSFLAGFVQLQAKAQSWFGAMPC